MYNQAFDIYHNIYRIVYILDRLNDHDVIEIDRLRMWDYYLLFPQQIHSIRLNTDFKDAIEYRKKYIKKDVNPYDNIFDGRKLLERLKPYQLCALNCLASYGIIDTDKILNNEIKIASREKLDNLINNTNSLSIEENNVLSWLLYFFKEFPMNGPLGLKSRTNLLISKYDGN